MFISKYVRYEAPSVVRTHGATSHDLVMIHDMYLMIRAYQAYLGSLGKSTLPNHTVRLLLRYSYLIELTRFEERVTLQCALALVPYIT